MSDSSRAVALQRWWTRLNRPDRDRARTAVTAGAVPDGLLRTLISAGVLIVADGYLSNQAPATVFPVPADVAAFVRAHPDLPG